MVKIVQQNPQLLLLRAAFQKVSPQPAMVHRVISLQVQNPAFAFVELQRVPLCPALQPKLRIKGTFPSVGLKVKGSFPAERCVRFVNCTNSCKNLTSLPVPLGYNITEEVSQLCKGTCGHTLQMVFDV